MNKQLTAKEQDVIAARAASMSDTEADTMFREIAAQAKPADGSLTRFDRAEPDAHFALPARPTVKQQLEYFSAYAETRNEPLYLRMWRSAQPLIVEWECAALPDRAIDLDKITATDAATVIMWAGNITLQHMNELDALPKA